MNFVVFFSGIVLSLFSSIDAQDLWVTQSPSAQLNAVHFPTKDTGYAVGEKGMLLKTTDAGAHWNPLPTGTAVTFNAVYFTSAAKGFAVGAGGIITETTDGGATWNAGLKATLNTLCGITFTDSLTGYAVGADSTILKTIDGGANWVKKPSPAAGTFYSVRFTAPGKGCIVGSAGVILKTADGEKWEKQGGGANFTTSNLLSLHFADTAVGYAVGANGTVLKTVNGGTVWAAVKNPTNTNLYATYFSDTATGYAVAEDNKIYKTTTGGTAWTSLTIETSTGLRGLCFTNAATGYAVGPDRSVLTTSNGGATWNAQSNGTRNLLFGVAFADSLVGWAVGDYGYLKTSNGGATWIPHFQGPGDLTFFSSRIVNVQFLGPDTGYAVGQDRSVLKTTDGGSTWKRQTIPDNGKNSANICLWFQDTNVGFIGGEDGTLLKTVNGGALWTQTKANTTQRINDFYFRNADTGYAAGMGGVLLKSTNGGLDWSPLKSGTTEALTSICFTKAGNGYITAGVGHILMASRNDTAWGATTVSTSTLALYSIRFADDLTGYAVGESGVILKTVDAGGHWISEPSGTSEALRCVRIVGDHSVYAAGYTGVILKTGRNFSLTPPVLKTPANGSKNLPLRPTFSWSTQAGATFYGLEVSLDSLFSNGYKFNGLQLGSAVYGDNLVPTKEYFWHVRAGNAGGVSEWSDVWRLTASDSVPAKPVLVAPLSGQSATMPVTLVWKKTPRAVSYILQFATTPDFTRDFQGFSPILDTTYSLSGLRENVPYFWSIQAENEAGIGPISSLGSFTAQKGTPIFRGRNVPTTVTFAPASGKSFLFGLPKSGYVTLKLYDQTGKSRGELISGFYEAGYHTVSAESKRIPAGSYVLDFTAQGFRKQVEWKGL